MSEGIIFDIKRYAIHDGPGIRTTVFMKGCPLRCIWCHNPESQKLGFEIMYLEYKCIHCYTCVHVCPYNLIYFDDEGMQHIHREKCKYCKICTDNCPSGALEFVGRKISVEELIEIIEKDITLYDSSGGGVTFSGGEPLMQPEFLKEALEECKNRKINTALDTSGYAPRKVLESVMDYVDIFLYDIKLYDPEKHRKYTGVSNEIIKDNLKFLVNSGRGKNIILRFPVIPTITDTEENIEGWKEFIMNLGGIREINLLPYHDVSEKFRRLGREYKMPVHEFPSEEKMKEIKEKFEEIGLYVKIGG
jgi:pyruvate formate lyase activating enzyme